MNVRLMLRRDSDGLADALASGGDERIALDAKGVNKYLCPPTPAPDLACLSSCTASPISDRSYDAALQLHRRFGGADEAGRPAVIAAAARDVRARIAAVFGIADLTEILLCPSGTDAMLTATVLLGAERPEVSLTVILPNAAETGSGVPVAASGRPFSTANAQRPPLTGHALTTIEIPLRAADGNPLDEGEVSAAFRAAARASTDRPVVVLTHGTKTGLIAPAEAPDGIDVIVDACQGRIMPATIRFYLARGWPVVITGSKFYGGPAFSGAVLVPRPRWVARGRLPAALHRHAALPGHDGPQPDDLGMLLRWTAALAEIDAFHDDPDYHGSLVRWLGDSIERRIREDNRLFFVEGLSPSGKVWADRPSIFTFGFRDASGQRNQRSAQELRRPYEWLAQRGILVGQPVGLGPFGALRIAVGARDAGRAGVLDDLARFFDLIGWAPVTAAAPAAAKA